MSNITAWHDFAKKKEALKSITEIRYYMIYAETPEERTYWAMKYDEYNESIEEWRQKKHKEYSYE